MEARSISIVHCPGRGEMSGAKCDMERRAGKRPACEECPVHTACPDCGFGIYMKMHVGECGVWACADDDCGWEGDRIDYGLAVELADVTGCKVHRIRTDKKSERVARKEPAPAKRHRTIPCGAGCGRMIHNQSKSGLCRGCAQTKKQADKHNMTVPEWLEARDEGQHARDRKRQAQRNALQNARARKNSKTCVDCGASIVDTATRCRACANRLRGSGKSVAAPHRGVEAISGLLKMDDDRVDLTPVLERIATALENIAAHLLEARRG